MDIKQEEPSLHEAESPPDWQSKPFISAMMGLSDNLKYFEYQFNDEDLQLVTQDSSCNFRK